MSNSLHHYSDGKSGLAPGEFRNNADQFSYAVGKMEHDLKIQSRQDEERLAASGPEHEHGIQITILILGYAATFAILWKVQILPLEIWQVGLICIVSIYATYRILKLLPNWLSGSIMGLSLGGFSGYLGWAEGGIYWASGLALGIGGIMYWLFSRVE
ncbi:MAG: hypothetical protein OQL28_10755 [Sedimenticola sp.]|nr:hypothetical protein [Sedimenticola sp.]